MHTQPYGNVLSLLPCHRLTRRYEDVVPEKWGEVEAEVVRGGIDKDSLGTVSPPSLSLTAGYNFAP